MTKQLERELVAWLQRQAEQTEYALDLAPGALRKIRQLRRQRRFAVVAVAAAALGIIVPAGSQAMSRASVPDQVANPPTTSAEPAPTPSITAPAPTQAGPVVLDFGTLPHGTTNVSWWDAGTGAIRWGEYSLPLGPQGAPEGFGRLASDGDPRYVTFQTTGEAGARLDLVGDVTGQVLTKNAGTFAVSAGGKQVAYTTGQDRGVSVASSSGEVQLRRTFDDPPEIAGFAGNNLILWSREAELASVSVWNLGTDRVRTIKGTHAAQTTAAAKGLVTVETGSSSTPGTRCFSVIDVGNGDRPVGKPVCGSELVSLSPDGRYAVLEPVADRDSSAIPYTFVDVRTGREVMQLQADTWNGITWEPDGTHVVLNAFAGDRNALVRCDLSGACELISTPLPWEESNLYALPVT